jgi:hypothetical protein
MALTDQQMQAMDKVSGIDMVAMDKAASGTPTQPRATKSPADAFGALSGPVNFLLGGAMNIAQDVGSGMRNSMEQPIFHANEQQAKQLEDQAYATNDMQQRKSLLQRANQIRSTVSNEAGDISKSFSPDLNDNPIVRSLIGATQIAGAAGAPEAALNTAKTGIDIAKAIPQLPKYLTKSGVAGLTENAASKATKAGQSIHWDDLIQQARDKVIKQFGDNAATREAFDNVTASRVPAGIEDPLAQTQLVGNTNQVPVNDLVKALLGELKTTPDKAISPVDELLSQSAKPIANAASDTLHMTPDQLLQLRRNLLNSYGKSILQGSTDKGISALEQKIAGIVRGSVSKNLHNIAPETIRPDKLYSMYSKGGVWGGDVPHLLLKYLAAPAIAGVIGKPLTQAAMAKVSP